MNQGLAVFCAAALCSMTPAWADPVKELFPPVTGSGYYEQNGLIICQERTRNCDLTFAAPGKLLLINEVHCTVVSFGEILSASLDVLHVGNNRPRTIFPAKYLQDGNTSAYELDLTTEYPVIGSDKPVVRVALLSDSSRIEINCQLAGRFQK